MARITADNLRACMDAGTVRFAPEPGGGAPACWVGDDWFYFAGAEGDLQGAEAYLNATPVDDMLREAADAISDWEEEPSFADEHAYMSAVVRETLLEICEQVAEDASNLRHTASFLNENEQFGDDWSHEVASLDRAIAAFDDMEACLRAEAERFDDGTARA